MKSIIVNMFSKLWAPAPIVPGRSSQREITHPERHRARVPSCSTVHEHPADESWCEFLHAIGMNPSREDELVDAGVLPAE